MGPTELLVDLDAISRNLRRLRDRCGGLPAIAAVKANAYGHGLVAVARHLEQEVAAFGVATVEEGARLRQAGITRPILKFSPALDDELPDAIAAGMDLTITSLEGVEAVSRAARAAGVVVGVTLKVDTGMRRIGVEPDDAPAIARTIRSHPGLRLDGIATHFAVADEPDGRDFTERQIAVFRRVVDATRAEAGDIAWVHTANSAGILGYDLDGDTAIRPGLALYGGGLLEPVARWTTRVLYVKRVRAGETVSYGRTWTAPEDTMVATLATGYGDGFSRLNSNRGRVLIRGASYPVIGRVCMDQTMVDLGGDTDVAAGDEVVLMGEDGDERIGVEELAEVMGTIPYEVTCLITPRVRRVYTRDA